jgi:ankyrin repeat protein
MKLIIFNKSYADVNFSMLSKATIRISAGSFCRMVRIHALRIGFLCKIPFICCLPSWKLINPRSALDRVWHMVLTRAVDPPTAKAFQEIFSLWSESIWFEEQQFLPLHKIILGIVDRDLASELRLSTSSIDKPDAKGRTPLAWAAARGDDTTLKTLLEFGANTNLTCVTGNSPLLRAVSAPSPACILPLLQHGVSVGSKSSLEFTALHYAAYYKDDGDYLTPLLDFGAEIDEKDSYGWTALACSAERNNSKSARLLLDRGADIESRDDAGWTPLLRSVNCNSHDVLTLLLRRGAICNANSFKGENILHFAAARGDCKTFGILAEASLGCLDINATNNDGITAEEIMSQRTFKPPDLAAAFHDLLETVAGTTSKTIPRDSHYHMPLSHEIFEAEVFMDALEHQEGESEPKVC